MPRYIRPHRNFRSYVFLQFSILRRLAQKCRSLSFLNKLFNLKFGRDLYVPKIGIETPDKGEKRSNSFFFFRKNCTNVMYQQTSQQFPPHPFLLQTKLGRDRRDRFFMEGPQSLSRKKEFSQEDYSQYRFHPG